MYVISFYGDSGDGMVSCDGESCNSLDFAMKFDNQKDAEDKKNELQKEWVHSTLKVDKVEMD